MDTFAFAKTHIGQRKQNEDWFRIADDLGLFVVADGMGGYEGGEIASRIAVEAVETFYKAMSKRSTHNSDDDFMKRSRMATAFRLANLEVRRRRIGTLAKMGSTLSALIIKGHRALIGHVGDSRVYRFRQGKLEQLTADHSLVEMMKEAGVSDQELHRVGHIITRAIGVNETTLPDICTEEIMLGDKFLLCTDGLTDLLNDNQISEVLADIPVADTCSALVKEALLRGGDDNITALFVEIVDEFSMSQSIAAAI